MRTRGGKSEEILTADKALNGKKHLQNLTVCCRMLQALLLFHLEILTSIIWTSTCVLKNNKCSFIKKFRASNGNSHSHESQFLATYFHNFLCQNNFDAGKVLEFAAVSDKCSISFNSN